MRLIASLLIGLIAGSVGAGFTYFSLEKAQTSSITFLKETSSSLKEQAISNYEKCVRSQVSNFSGAVSSILKPDFSNFENMRQEIAANRNFSSFFDGGALLYISGKPYSIFNGQNGIIVPIEEKDLPLLKLSFSSNAIQIGNLKQVNGNSYLFVTFPFPMGNGSYLLAGGWTQTKTLYSSCMGLEKLDGGSSTRVFENETNRIYFSDGVGINGDASQDPLYPLSKTDGKTLISRGVPFFITTATMPFSNSKQSFLLSMNSASLSKGLSAYAQNSYYISVGGGILVALLAYFLLTIPNRYAEKVSRELSNISDDVNVPWKISSPSPEPAAQKIYKAVSNLLFRMKEEADQTQVRFDQVRIQEMKVKENEKKIRNEYSQLAHDKEILIQDQKRFQENNRLLVEREQYLADKENRVELLQNKYGATARIASLILAVQEQMDDAVFIMDMDERVLWANEQSSKYEIREGDIIPDLFSKRWMMGTSCEVDWVQETSNERTIEAVFQDEDVNPFLRSPEVKETKPESHHLRIEFSKLANPSYKQDYIDSEFYLYAHIRDISEAKRMANITKKAANTDPLTGMLNRAGFQEMVQQFDHSGRDYSVFYIDLDKFKPVNDTYGHAAGDELLRLASMRFKISLNHDDLLARLGGDEFAIIAYCNPEQAATLAQTCVTAANMPFQLSTGISVQIGASIGVACSPNHAIGYEKLLEKADEAMYEAKRGGRNNWAFPKT